MTIDNSRQHNCTPSSMSGLLEVEVVRDELGRTVIFVRGELDRAAVPLLAGCLLAGCSTSLLRQLHLSGLFDGVDLVPPGQT
jgi:hypothetical protein